MVPKALQAIMVSQTPPLGHPERPELGMQPTRG
jgi:hypothetical protein